MKAARGARKDRALVSSNSYSKKKRRLIKREGGITEIKSIAMSTKSSVVKNKKKEH